MSEPILLTVIFLLTGLLTAGISLPLIASRVPRNPLYGFRTPKTLASDRVWYEANRFSGRQLFWAGAILAAGSLLLLPFAPHLSADAVAGIGLALTMLPLGVAVCRSFRYLKRL